MKNIKTKYYAKLSIILIVGLFLGNRIFNHISSWGGIAIMIGSVIYLIYKLFKTK